MELRERMGGRLTMQGRFLSEGLTISRIFNRFIGETTGGSRTVTQTGHAQLQHEVNSAQAKPLSVNPDTLRVGFCIDAQSCAHNFHVDYGIQPFCHFPLHFQI